MKLKKINKKLFFYYLSKTFKVFLSRLFYGRKKIPFKPIFVSLEVAEGCCLKCLQCDLWKRPYNSKIKLKEAKRIVTKLHQWLGVFQLNFTGGEVFLNEDLIDLIKFTSQKGILTHLNTNGVLINKQLAKKIATSGLNSLSVSLDSLKPGLHNRLRGNKQALKRAMRALEWLNSYRSGKKLFLTVSTIIMKQNLAELPKLVKWVKQNGLDGILFQALWQNFGANYNLYWFKLSPFWPNNHQKVKKVLVQLIEMKKKKYPIENKIEELQRYRKYFFDPIGFGLKNKCFVGTNSFIINSKGDVSLCFNFPPIGNVLKDKPEKLWNSFKAQEQRVKITDCQRGCKILLCNYPIGPKEAIIFLSKLIIDKIKKML